MSYSEMSTRSSTPMPHMENIQTRIVSLVVVSEILRVVSFIRVSFY